MNGDIFTSSSKNNQKKRITEDENNFFLKRDTLMIHNQNEPIKHLNDYDFNILKEDAYKDVSDDVFKLEYKITKAEQNVEDIDKQIQAAKEIMDFSAAEKLFERRKQVQKELGELVEMYNNTGLSAKISGGFNSKIKNKFRKFEKDIYYFIEKILSLLSWKMSNFFEIKNSLEKLENINKSVDELIALKIPYGESQDKYDQLSKYIVKANAIQSNISKFIKL